MSLSDRDIDITTFLDPNLPTRVRGDAGRVQQLFVNIVGNAVKFTRQGEVAIEVRAVSLHTLQEIDATQSAKQAGGSRRSSTESGVSELRAAEMASQVCR
jgi:nitrogen-specific signal transduction histidine kinase